MLESTFSNGGDFTEDPSARRYVFDPFVYIYFLLVDSHAPSERRSNNEAYEGGEPEVTETPNENAAEQKPQKTQDSAQKEKTDKNQGTARNEDENPEKEKNCEGKQIGGFIIGKTKGKGTFGKVKQGTHIVTGDKVAIKILEKDKIKD